MPTTIAYTVPLAQMNKICLQMEKLIADHSKTPFEEKLVPYMKDLIKQLREKDVIITNRQARALYPDYDVPDNDDYLFKNNKQTNLSMFGQRNKFSGLYLPNQYGVNVSYNFMPSLASYAQIHRHRSSDFEMIIPEQFSSVIPDLIKDKPELLREWIKDLYELQKIENKNLTILDAKYELYEYVDTYDKKKSLEIVNKVIPEIELLSKTVENFKSL